LSGNSNDKENQQNSIFSNCNYEMFNIIHIEMPIKDINCYFWLFIIIEEKKEAEEKDFYVEKSHKTYEN
jgi:hypothetical protein